MSFIKLDEFMVELITWIREAKEGVVEATAVKDAFKTLIDTAGTSSRTASQRLAAWLAEFGMVPDAISASQAEMARWILHRMSGEPRWAAGLPAGWSAVRWLHHVHATTPEGNRKGPRTIYSLYVTQLVEVLNAFGLTLEPLYEAGTLPRPKALEPEVLPPAPQLAAVTAPAPTTAQEIAELRLVLLSVVESLKGLWNELKEALRTNQRGLFAAEERLSTTVDRAQKSVAELAVQVGRLNTPPFTPATPWTPSSPPWAPAVLPIPQPIYVTDCKSSGGTPIHPM